MGKKNQKSDADFKSVEKVGKPSADKMAQKNEKSIY
jgi:hypothetical protein